MSDANGDDRDADSRDLHVLHVADRGVFMRFGPMLRQLFLGLADADVAISVLTDDPQAPQRFIPPTAEAHVVPSLSGWRAWTLPGLLSERMVEQPNLAHCWGVRTVAAVERWAQRQDLPLLLHALSTADVLWLNRRGARPDQYVAGACESLCRALGARKPVSHFPIQRLSPGVLAPVEGPPARGANRTLGLICLGRITAGSGVDTLIEALALLRQRKRELQSIIIGRGPHEDRLRGMIHSCGLQDRVSVIDETSVWADMLGGVDVYVVPARQQELSLGPLTAMALARTVIASRDQIAEWFVEDSTAWMFTPGSAVELAECLARADSDREKATQLGRAARAWVRERHTASRLISETVAFYESAAHTRKTVSFRKPRGRA